jgi:hypothetical protein
MRRYIFPAIVVVAVAVGWVIALPPAALTQPIAFNHARHAAINCVVCHQGARSGARSGIPQGDTCGRCHATEPPGVSEAAWSDIAAGQKIPWLRLTRLPEHVAFSHRRHTGAAQLACESCHGDMSRRTVPPARAPVRLVMDTCLSCHRREGASEDCAGCHR